MIVIGVDTHKRSHTLVALDAATGAARGQLTIPASDDGTLDALRFAGELDSERVWALEDCRHVSGRLERGLVASGDRVVRVAPGLTETSRRAVREPGKSDPIDATAIARAALREGIDTLPVAFLDEQAHEIRVLNDYRDQLISECGTSAACAGIWCRSLRSSKRRSGPLGWKAHESGHDSPASSGSYRTARSFASRKRS
jgi:transposase